jgi:hypothetical protein
MNWKTRMVALPMAAASMVGLMAAPTLAVPASTPVQQAPAALAVATNPYPAAWVNTGYTDRARWTINVLRDNRPALTSCHHGNFDPDSGHSPDSYHYSGNAGDCYAGNTPGQWPGPIDKDQLQRAANFLVANAGPLKVQQVIWNGKIWTWPRRSEGWRTYDGGSGIVGGHYDHVHVSIARIGDGR